MAAPSEFVGTPASPPTTWVLGASGLLGSAVVRALRRQGRAVTTSSVPWHDEEAAVATLLHDAAGLPSSGWRMAWCAGAGVVATAPEALNAEVRVVERFLAQWDSGAGAAFFVSSAGGLYAGSAGPPFDEQTTPAPLAPYGHAKLRLEAAFTEHAHRTGGALLVGRLANLYGPGQDLHKPQGLITQLCRAVMTHERASIYVSLDTLRDYLFVDDAAAMVCAGLEEVACEGGVHVKVLASGQTLSIAEVLGELTRLARRRPPVVLGSSPSARFQVRDLRLRSRAWPPLQHLVRTPVPVGMARCLDDVAVSVRAGGCRSEGGR